MLKTTIIAEIGSNWEGSIYKAQKLIKKCKKAGANVVKFQMWRAQKNIHIGIKLKNQS